MRRLARAVLPLAALAAIGAAGVLPALAADQHVVAMNLKFTPKTTALMPGETITISNGDGAIQHSLQFEDDSAPRQAPGTGWTVQRTFTAGEARDAPYRFFCTVHLGMEGYVYVNATGTVPAPTPTPTPTTTPDPTPSATPDPTPTAQAGGGGGAPGGGGSATGDQNSTAHGTPPELRSLKLLTAVACPRRTARCRAPGVALRIDLSAPARVRGTLRRRAPGSTRLAAFGSVRLGRVAAGPRTVRFTRTAAGRRLAPGAYKLRLTAAGSVRSLAFRVRAAR